MLFNSIDFAVFLPLVFLIYWLWANRTVLRRNSLVVLASYVFYGWWDWRFLSLIALSTAVDFIVARSIDNSSNSKERRQLLSLSLIVNLGLLGIFKYYNFFLESFVDAFVIFGFQLSADRLDIVLPVGISFYTFQTLSYTIDVYRRDLKPTNDPLAFAAFVSFFPQLVAGPIERAASLLPQFYRCHRFDRQLAVDGLRQMLWGFVKKIVIADNCAPHVDQIFSSYSTASGSTLALGAILFAFQIYGDFSGYSDIAIGTSRLFGLHLNRNFAFPYFSRDIAEFWRRWHISLSSWFRDYIYIPLGGSRGSRAMRVRNTFVIFLVSGFWHGANWTFIVWGGIHALMFLPLLLRDKNRHHVEPVAASSSIPTPSEVLRIASTFTLTTLAWIFFRADNLTHATLYIAGIFSRDLFSVPELAGETRLLTITSLITGFMVIEWAGRKNAHALEKIGFSWHRPARLAFYYSLLAIILFLGRFEQNAFIYFQF